MESEHPASMTARAIKQTLPDRTVVTKEARAHINTATSMFTLYLSAIAHDISVKNKRSTITLKDVLAALRETEFDQFIDPVEQCLQDTKAADARKKAHKEALKAGAAVQDDAIADEDAHEPTAPEAEEEVPLETDADLDGDRTVDEDEVDEDDDEVTEQHDEAMETTAIEASAASNEIIDEAMEESKDSE